MTTLSKRLAELAERTVRRAMISGAVNGQEDKQLLEDAKTLTHAVAALSDAESNAAMLARQCDLAREAETMASEYARHNPLGWSANVFLAMASRIKAGEDYYAVLADYGLKTEQQSARPDR